MLVQVLGHGMPTAQECVVWQIETNDFEGIRAHGTHFGRNVWFGKLKSMISKVLRPMALPEVCFSMVSKDTQVFTNVFPMLSLVFELVAPVSEQPAANFAGV